MRIAGCRHTRNTVSSVIDNDSDKMAYCNALLQYDAVFKCCLKVSLVSLPIAVSPIELGCSEYSST